MQSTYTRPISIRWSDLDPNFHVRHSVYYDWGAQQRLSFLYEHGITPQMMGALHFGVVLFREEAIFKREILPGDTININFQLLRATRDMRKWSIRHELSKPDGTLCAIITVDGAWLDTKARKITAPPAQASSVFEAAPKALDFEWAD
jgi:acyl-CoA thioester hydrolase